MSTTMRPVLLVEDNADDEFLILRSLRAAHLANEVVVARDGQEALDLFQPPGLFAGRGAHMLPSVVLLDLKLPRIGGLEVLQSLRSQERTRLLPVVILTSSDEEEDIIRGYLGGANSYVRKPVDHRRFNEVVRQVGLYWALVNETALGS